MKRVLTIVLATVLLSACVKSRKEPRLEVTGGQFETPAGAFDVTTTTFDGRHRDGNWNMYFVARSPTIAVKLAPFGKRPVLMVDHRTGSPQVEFLTDGSYFQVDDDERLRIGGKSERFKNANDEWTLTQLKFDAPPQVANLIGSTHIRLSELAVERIRDGRWDHYRFHFPFTVDGQPHLLDVTFELHVETEWYWAVPGTP